MKELNERRNSPAKEKCIKRAKKTEQKSYIRRSDRHGAWKKVKWCKDKRLNPKKTKKKKTLSLSFSFKWFGECEPLGPHTFRPLLYTANIQIYNIWGRIGRWFHRDQFLFPIDTIFNHDFIHVSGWLIHPQWLNWYIGSNFQLNNKMF